MNGYTGFTDMIDGGGPGQSGDRFEGGGFISALANLFARPYGYNDRAAGGTPQPRPAAAVGGGAPAAAMPAPRPGGGAAAAPSMVAGLEDLYVTAPRMGAPALGFGSQLVAPPANQTGMGRFEGMMIDPVTGQMVGMPRG